MASYTLPTSFLKGPGPTISKEIVDFKKTSLPEYDAHFAVILDNVFTEEECNTLVRAAEAGTDGKWEQAMVNVGNGRQRTIKDVRDCGRIIWDDRDVVGRIWGRIKDCVPEVEKFKHRRGNMWQMTRLNERMRFLRYGEGQYFRPHVDGSFATPGNEEVSFYTLHLYLNDATSPDTGSGKLKGGATTFHSMNMKREYDVNPKIGRVLIFQHAYLLHSGAEVDDGIKLTLRTDLMFKKAD